MRRKHASKLDVVEKTVRETRRATQKHHAAEEEIRIALEGLRGKGSIAELCCREGNRRTEYCRSIFQYDEVKCEKLYAVC